MSELNGSIGTVTECATTGCLEGVHVHAKRGAQRFCERHLIMHNIKYCIDHGRDDTDKYVNMLAKLDTPTAATTGGKKFPETAKEFASLYYRQGMGKRMADEALAKLDAQTFELPEMPTLADLLAEDDEDQAYRIQGLIPTGGRIILSAPMKSGKTTLVGNLVRSLADGDPFLGYFEVTPLGDDATITILDTEMSKRQMKSWLRDQGIQNPQRVHALSLRGSIESFAIMDPATRTIWADQLREMNTEILILDPLGPLFDAFGIDENTNAVGTVLAAIDALADEAGIQEVFIMHHTGHEGERARGHSKLRGWPDAEWHLIRKTDDDSDMARYFSAFGRDVAVKEGLLDYDQTTRHLVMNTDPWDGEHEPVNRRNAVERVKLENMKVNMLAQIIDSRETNDGQGIKATALWAAIGTKPERGGTKLRDELVSEGMVTVRKVSRTEFHSPTPKALDMGEYPEDDLL